MADKTKRSVTCDLCDKELIVDSPYPHNWGLELEAIDFGINSGDIVFEVFCDPPIERKHHFCGLQCLARWSSRAGMVAGTPWRQEDER